jgi:hypothetical protein
MLDWQRGRLSREKKRRAELSEKNAVEAEMALKRQSGL